jgi:predicted phosphodiesterase
MRVFALSDIHVDYDANARWVAKLSRSDYLDDVLILAGDVSDSLDRFSRCIEAFVQRFRKVFFVPGNHDLWVIRDEAGMDSIEKFDKVRQAATGCGATLRAEVVDEVGIIPLLGWYDNSFGAPEPSLRDIWMDYRACRWPDAWSDLDITNYFVAQNDLADVRKGRFTISFSHFLPRIDLMPNFIPIEKRNIYPVLGSTRLEGLVRDIGPDIHVYGHSHVNRSVIIDGVNYVNNAFAYPHEERIAFKALRCIYHTG